MKIIEYLKNINILLVIIDILFLTISFLFLNKKKYNNKVKDLFIIIYTLINILLFSYINNIFQAIFTFKFLSVKLYLIIALISLIIFLYTFNKKIKIYYKITNYLMVIITHIFLVLNVYIAVSNKLEILNFIDIKNSIKLMNISLIIFFIYIVLLELIYIIYHLIQNKKNIVVIDNKENLDDNKIQEELSKHKKGETFYINGTDCSIIFCDSNQSNIIKNYKILSKNIDATMVNGYTLKENNMIRNILTKLNTNNLSNIDLNNFNILNKIDVDEYNFLKEVFNKD